MGNLHFITQTKPTITIEGAALLVKKEFHEKVKKMKSEIQKVSYVDLREEQISFIVPATNIDGSLFKDPEKKLYVLIKSGGKWGYDTGGFLELFEKLACYLEDTTFYLSDEYAGYVQEFKIKEGHLKHEYVVESGSTNLEYLKKNNAANKEFLFQLYYQEIESYITDGYLNDEAIKLIKKALQIKPTAWQLYHWQGYFYNKLLKFDKALTSLNKCLKLIPNPQEVRVTVAKEFSTENIAITNARKALKFKPDQVDSYWFEDAEISLVLAYRNIYLNLGIAYKGLKNYDQALSHFFISEKIIPTYQDVQALSYIAQFYIDRGNYARGLEYCDKLIKVTFSTRQVALAYYNKACAYAKQKNLKKAFYFLELACELDRYRWKSEAQKDKDLKPLWPLKKFKELVK
jgi:tetratricopeptide (TPR) repeat protein